MATTLIRDISFGDCDPAGIVFYPNVFRWMDAAFHELLRPHGGHATLCDTLGMVGLGLVDASVQFRHPMRDGDRLHLHVSVDSWSRRSLTARHEGRVNDRTTFVGQEVRCLFRHGDTGMTAADLAPFRALLEGDHG